MWSMFVGNFGRNTPWFCLFTKSFHHTAVLNHGTMIALHEPTQNVHRTISCNSVTVSPKVGSKL
jgi:hypothetical protein